MEKYCQNCNEIATNNFCSNCGHPTKLKRIDREYAAQEFLNLIGFEKGFIFTFKELAIRPGKTVINYLTVNRNQITKPIAFLILSSFIYTFVSQYLGISLIISEEQNKIYGDSTYIKFINWVSNNYGYSNLLMLLPITLWTKLLFRKHRYNFYETFVMVCLYMAEAMLFLTIILSLNKLFDFSLSTYNTIITITMFIYISWAISLFYEKSFKNFIKAFFSYLIGFFTFQIIAAFITTIYDILIKN